MLTALCIQTDAEISLLGTVINSISQVGIVKSQLQQHLNNKENEISTIKENDQGRHQGDPEDVQEHEAKEQHS